MSEYIVKNTGIASEIHVYDLDESIKASKYPMAVDIGKLNSDITTTVKKLAAAGKGEGHDQFLTGIRVNFDLTCTNKMWVEAERYRFLEFVSSQSTMHKITKFDIEKQCIEYVSPVIIEEVNRLIEEYNKDPSKENRLKVVYNVPSGFKLTARLTTNYRCLKGVYAQRKGHPLDEWSREFMHFIKSLPHANELIIGESDGKTQEKGD